MQTMLQSMFKHFPRDDTTGDNKIVRQLFSQYYKSACLHRIDIHWFD